MNPNLIWEELQAKMGDSRREAAHRHLEGEVHRACQVCGADNPEHAVACSTCGVKLRPIRPDTLGFGP